MATTQVMVWLQEETAAALRREAAAQGVKISALADAAIRQALGQGSLALDAPASSAAITLRDLEEMVRRIVDDGARAEAERARAATERLASLQVKTLREASVARWLAYAAILHARGRAVAAEDTTRAFTAAGKTVRGRVEPATVGLGDESAAR